VAVLAESLSSSETLER